MMETQEGMRYSQVEEVTSEKWGRTFERPIDAGDIAAATDIARLYLKLNPEGLVFLYAPWPPMEGGEPRDGMRGAEFPLRDQFDYEEQWLRKYTPTDKPWIGHVNRTQDFCYQVFEGMKANLPELWKAGRLRMIPAGDLFLALDKKMRVGQVPGIARIQDFYTDVQHIRAGLPRYTVAALFYACLFEQSPEGLDWTLYNDKAKYGEDLYHDKGELLEITPQTASLVNSVIWETVNEHPHTHMELEK